MGEREGSKKEGDEGCLKASTMIPKALRDLGEAKPLKIIIILTLVKKSCRCVKSSWRN